MHIFTIRNRQIFAQTAVAIVQYHVIPLYPEAAEIPELLYLVVIQEILELAGTPPQVYQLGDKIDTRLNGQHVTGLQLSGQTQGLETELCTSRMTVISYPGLSESLHVMHVKAQHMTEAVGEEQGMGSLLYSLVYIAFHKTHTLEIFCHHLTCPHMHIQERHSGPEGLHCGRMGVKHYVVYHPLPIGKPLAYRRGG